MLSSLSSVLPSSQVFTSGYVNAETILYFFYKISNREEKENVPKTLKFITLIMIWILPKIVTIQLHLFFKNYNLSNAALVVETTEIDDLCKNN